MSSLEEFTGFACAIAEEAGRAILPHFRQAIDIDNKAEPGRFDPVTAADRGAEAVIRSRIEAAYPDHGILGEEHGRRAGTSPYTWIIDPIDGTRSFILGQMHWATLIALNDGTRPVLGVVHQPYVGETFVGTAAGAECRRGDKVQRLKTRRCPRLADASVCTTHPDLFTTRRERAAFELVAANARLVRHGGDCYSYCLLAAGLVDAVIESGLQPYDIQALMPIIEAAGGIVTDWTGGSAAEGGQVVAAGSAELHRELLQILAWGR